MAENMRYEAKSIEKKYIIPFIKKYGSERSEGTWFFQNDKVRIEGSEKTGFVVVALEEGRVIHHTEIHGYSYEIRMEDHKGNPSIQSLLS